MPKTDAQKRAEKRYRAKCREFKVVCYPNTDNDVIERLEAQEAYSRYIKELVRKDISDGD